MPPWCPLGDAGRSRAQAAARRNRGHQRVTTVGTALPYSSRTSLLVACTPGSLSASFANPTPSQTGICHPEDSPPELLSPAQRQLPEASEHPHPARHAPRSAQGKPQAPVRDMVPEGASTLAWLWGRGVRNAHPNAESGGQLELDGRCWTRTREHSIQLSPATSVCPCTARGTCWHTHLCHQRLSPAPRHTPWLPHSPAAAAAPWGAQAQLSAPRPCLCPCLRPACLAHTAGCQGCCPREQSPAAVLGAGRRQLGEERFPSPGTHATVTARNAPGLLNLPSAAPHVPPFRLGPAKYGLTLPGQAGTAEPASAPA